MRRWLLLPVAILVLAVAVPAGAQDKPHHGGELVFVYLPLNVRQNLAAGGSK